MADQQLQEKLQAFIEQKVKEGYAPCLGAIIFTKDEACSRASTFGRCLIRCIRFWQKVIPVPESSAKRVRWITKA